MRIQLDWFSDKLAQRLADIAAGRAAPVPPRDASTVMVLRQSSPGGTTPMVLRQSSPGGTTPRTPRCASDGEDRHRTWRAAGPGATARGRGSCGPVGGDVEVLMLRRTAAMKFAPGAYVFPGGSVDPADSSLDIGWWGPAPAEFGARLGASAELARSLVCAAVRETFEESGVLLAGAPDGGPLADTSGPSWEADRMALVAGTATLADLLAKRGLVLRADLLVPWARWVTPAGESRRFDARFFVTALPAGQRAAGHEAEADKTAWLRPAEAISAARAGEISLLPPTAVTLNDFAVVVASGGGVADILAQRREIKPVHLRLVLEGGQAWLVVPDGVEYPL